MFLYVCFNMDIVQFGLGFWGLVLLAAIILFIICFILAINTEFKDNKQKLLWIVAITFLPLLGPIAYLLLRKRFKK
ncbi:MAG: PLDc N-terminal domain-containing protein [Bacteroidota bacterium]